VTQWSYGRLTGIGFDFWTLGDLGSNPNKFRMARFTPVCYYGLHAEPVA